MDCEALFQLRRPWGRPFVIDLLVLVPTLDLDIVEGHRAEGADEGGGEAGVGDKRDIEVDGGSTDVVSVGQLLVGEVLRDVDHEVEFLVCEHLHRLLVFACKFRVLGFGRPDYALGRHTVLSEVSA